MKHKHIQKCRQFRFTSTHTPSVHANEPSSASLSFIEIGTHEKFRSSLKVILAKLDQTKINNKKNYQEVENMCKEWYINSYATHSVSLVTGCFSPSLLCLNVHPFLVQPSPKRQRMTSAGRDDCGSSWFPESLDYKRNRMVNIITCQKGGKSKENHFDYSKYVYLKQDQIWSLSDILSVFYSSKILYVCQLQPDSWWWARQANVSVFCYESRNFNEKSA